MKKKAHEKLTPLELEVMQALWKRGSASIRQLHDALPAKRKVEYTTVQTIVYRLEKKGALQRTKKIGNAHIFEAQVTQRSAVGSLVDDFLSLFGGSTEPVMTHMVESGKLTLADIKALETAIRASEKNEGKMK